jgi:hypothetical protein
MTDGSAATACDRPFNPGKLFRGAVQCQTQTCLARVGKPETAFPLPRALLQNPQTAEHMHVTCLTRTLHPILRWNGG